MINKFFEFFNEFFFKKLTINSLFSSVAWKTKIRSLNFLFINLIKSHKIGNKTLVSDFLLPANIEIIFLSLFINEDKSILDLLSCSSKG